MQKLGRIVKETCEKDIRKNIDTSSCFFVVKYSGVASADMSNLRLTLKGTKSRMFIAKNSISRRVLNDIGLAEISAMLQGPCGFVFVKDDPSIAAKALYTFSKENKKMELEGGFLVKRVLSKNDVVTLANLPSKTVLYTKLVTTLSSPVRSYVWAVSGILKKFVIALDQIKQKKETKN
jgi:large subunit ribosomal protein L10